MLVSWARWQAQREALFARGGELGVQLPNAVEPSVLAADVAKLSLIALGFLNSLTDVPTAKRACCVSAMRITVNCVRWAKCCAISCFIWRVAVSVIFNWRVVMPTQRCRRCRRLACAINPPLMNRYRCIGDAKPTCYDRRLRAI